MDMVKSTVCRCRIAGSEVFLGSKFMRNERRSFTVPRVADEVKAQFRSFQGDPKDNFGKILPVLPRTLIATRGLN